MSSTTFSDRVRAARALVIAFAGAAGTLDAQQMYVETCNLGCSSGGGGQQVSCAIISTYENLDIAVFFSRPVDFQSVSLFTFRIADVNTGALVAGSFFLDPTNSSRLNFRPLRSFDAMGNLTFGFAPDHIYRITIPGVAQGDSPPFIRSTDMPALDNQSRMQCDILTSLGVLTTGTAYCAGDGMASACPCGNVGGPGRGCANSVDASGALLRGIGHPEISLDDLLLLGSGMPNGTAFYFQGTARVNGGAGTVFGDGLRCAGGTLARLGVEQNANGSSHYPSSGRPRISIQGHITSPGSRTYQTWYRNAASFCTSATFNLSNGLEIVWSP